MVTCDFTFIDALCPVVNTLFITVLLILKIFIYHNLFAVILGVNRFRRVNCITAFNKQYCFYFYVIKFLSGLLRLNRKVSSSSLSHVARRGSLGTSVNAA